MTKYQRKVQVIKSLNHALARIQDCLFANGRKSSACEVLEVIPDVVSYDRITI